MHKIKLFQTVHLTHTHRRSNEFEFRFIQSSFCLLCMVMCEYRGGGVTVGVEFILFE